MDRDARSNMGRAIVVAMLALSLVLGMTLLAVGANAPATPERICDHNPTAIARAIVARELGVGAGVVTVLAVNDVRCEALDGRPGGADMANVALEVDSGRQRLYGIYHTHLTDREDTVASAAPIMAFRPMADGRWHHAWCELIGAVYHDERVKHGCPER